VCVCVCVSVFPQGYLRNHTRDLYQLFVHVAYSRSSSGFVALHDVLLVLWMTSCCFYNGPYSGMNFATEDRFCLYLLIYHKIGQNSILTNYFEITCKLK